MIQHLKRRLINFLPLLLILGLANCNESGNNNTATSQPITINEPPRAMPVAIGNESKSPETDLSTAVARVAKEALQGVVSVSIKEIHEVANPLYPFERDPFFQNFFGSQNMPKKFKQELRGLGSGIIIDTSGHVLTNYHVVASADDIKVSLADGEQYNGKVVGTDPKTDLAVIKIPGNEKLPALSFGNSDNMEVGDWVVAIGSPQGFYQTVTQGIISAKHRRGITEPSSYQDYLQTDAAINPGNSGGPLLNLHGEVIGINSAIFSQSGGFEGIGFAIPSNIAVHIANQIIAHGKVERGWLGISIQDLTPDLAESLGFKTTKGALVLDVAKDGPADQAGIRKDDLIIDYRGKPVTNVDGLRDAVANTAIGQEVPVTILRGEKEQQLTVKIGDLHHALEKLAASVGERLGVEVKPVSTEQMKKYQLEPEQGVLITSVKSNGVLGNAGLEAGDIILAINNQSVRGLDSYVTLVKSLKPYQQAVFLVLDHRTGQSAYVRIRL